MEVMLPLLVATPLAVALLFVVPALRPMAAAVAPWAAVPALGVALWVPTGASIEIASLLLGTRLALDLTGKVFLLFTAALWLICGLYARAYVGAGGSGHRFFVFLLLTMAGSLGVVVAADMIVFYTCFAVMSFASYGLIVHDGSAAAWRAGRVYIAFVVAGEALLFVGVVGLGALTGSLAFPGGTTEVSATAAGRLLLWLPLAGFGVKMGLVPLHMWLPLAHPAAPVPASAVLSGVIIKAGLLGWLRFLPFGMEAQPAAGTLLLVLGLVAAFGAVAAGLTQREVKAALAYSSVSQMGLITAALGAALLTPAAWPLVLPAVLLYALHHAFAKAALFLGVGVLAHTGEGLRARTLALIALALPAMALAGVPLTSGAVAKVALKGSVASAAVPVPLDWFLSLAAVGTTLLMGRVIVLMADLKGSADERAGAGLLVPWYATLAAVAATVWVLPWPGFGDVAPASLDVPYLWTTFWPAALGAGLAWAVWRRPALAGGAVGLRVPPGDLLVPAVSAMSVLERDMRAVPRVRDWRPILMRRFENAGVRGRVARWLGDTEDAMEQWHVAGGALLGLLVALLAWVGR